MNVAQTILQQLGGNRFIAMTGAKQLVAGPNFLQFSIGRGAKNKANKVRILLQNDDLYTIQFFSIRGVEIYDKGEAENVYGDKLAAVFAEHTGFDTRL